LKTFLGSGGLGDMLICFSKCFNHINDDERFHYTYIDEVTNRRTKVDYTKYSDEFLKLQNIDYNIISAKQFEYYQDHGKEYDFAFSPQVYGEVNQFLLRPNSIRSDSQPYIKFKLPELYDQTFLDAKKRIVITSFAGNGDDPRRSWSSKKFLQDLIKFLNVKLGYQIYLMGIQDDEKYDYCYDIRDLSLPEELVYIANSEAVICFSGFVHLFSCFENKKIICKYEGDAAKEFYFHPVWLENNVKFWYNESYTEILDKL